jgi:hypothetical protein
VTDNTDGPTGQDRSQQTLEWLRDEWLDPKEDAHALAQIEWALAGAGQDVAALRYMAECAIEERDELREQLTTARERIAALEALADRWEALPKLRSPNSDAYRTAKICAKQLRAALTGSEPHDESIRDDSEHFT